MSTVHGRRVAGTRSAVYVALLVGLTACAGTAGTNAAPADPAAESRLIEATQPDRRLEVLFDWTMSDRDARFAGRGLLRLDNSARARVDLFGPRGETLAAAVVEEGVMRVVPQSAAAMLPPPALLWSVLGVFRQPVDAPLTGTTATGTETRLDYQRDGTRWSFSFQDDRLRSTEWTDGTGRRTVELRGDAGFSLPAEAAFRDWTEFRELNLSVTEVEEKASFDVETWILPGER